MGGAHTFLLIHLTRGAPPPIVPSLSLVSHDSLGLRATDDASFTIPLGGLIGAGHDYYERARRHL
jgi:hypothetical protein